MLGTYSFHFEERERECERVYVCTLGGRNSSNKHYKILPRTELSQTAFQKNIKGKKPTECFHGSRMFSFTFSYFRDMSGKGGMINSDLTIKPRRSRA